MLLLVSFYKLLDFFIMFDKAEVLGSEAHHIFGYNLRLIYIQLFDVRIFLKLKLGKL